MPFSKNAVYGVRWFLFTSDITSYLQESRVSGSKILVLRFPGALVPMGITYTKRFWLRIFREHWKEREECPIRGSGCLLLRKRLSFQSYPHIHSSYYVAAIIFLSLLKKMEVKSSSRGCGYVDNFVFSGQ